MPDFTTPADHTIKLDIPAFEKRLAEMVALKNDFEGKQFRLKHGSPSNIPFPDLKLYTTGPNAGAASAFIAQTNAVMETASQLMANIIEYLEYFKKIQMEADGQ